MSKAVDICYYSSDFYAPYTGISMYSLCKNNPNLNFNLHCIDTGISEENKEKMFKVANEFGKTLVFHDYSVLEDYIKNDLKLPICGGSYATYIKVFPEKIFPDAESILFMDGDTIINGSIEELLSVDLSEHVFAAVKVPLINESWIYDSDTSDNLRFQYAKKFFNTGYYNIGVLYANLKRWKEVDFGGQIMRMKDLHLDTMSKARDVPIDEMLFNLAALEHVDEGYAVPLPAIFNATAHNIPYHRALKSALRCGYIDKKEFKEAYYHPVIVHYCIFKPWFTDCYTRYNGLVKKYRAQSPWPDAFTDKMYKSPAEKYFGRMVSACQYEWMMAFLRFIGHLFLRVKGRFSNLVSRFKARFSGRHNKSGSGSVPAGFILNGRLFSAHRRRRQRLREGDYAEAFHFPYRWSSAIKKAFYGIIDPVAVVLEKIKYKKLFYKKINGDAAYPGRRDSYSVEDLYREMQRDPMQSLRLLDDEELSQKMRDECQAALDEKMASDLYIRAKTTLELIEAKNGFMTPEQREIYSSPEKLKSWSKNCRWAEYSEDLSVWGDGNKIIATVDSWKERAISDRELLRMMPKIRRILPKLSDEKSRQVYLRAILGRLRFDPYLFADGFDYGVPDYFAEGFPLRSGESIVDCGAYTGDTLLEFINHNYMPDKYYGFEPAKESFEILSATIKDLEEKYSLDAEIFPYGVGSKEKSVHFTTNNYMGNCVSEDGEASAKIVPVDRVVSGPVTLLKYDVEGYELEALKGSKEIIWKYRPKLAVSLYHKTEDLTELPTYIMEHFPFYEHYMIRQHSYSIYETILYVW